MNEAAQSLTHQLLQLKVGGFTVGQLMSEQVLLGMLERKLMLQRLAQQSTGGVEASASAAAAPFQINVHLEK